MAYTIRLGVPDLRDLRADLEAVELGLGRALNRALVEAAEPIAATAKRLAPFDATHRGWRWNHQARGYEDPGHLRDSISARGATIGTVHPAGLVHEFGGSIAPRGEPFRVPRSAYALTAGETEAGQVERKAMSAVDQLLRRHDL